MPVPFQNPINTYTGNGVTVGFPYQFLLLRAGDLKVTVDGAVLTLTTHYSLSGIGSAAGGTVTFLVAPPAGAEVIVQRAVPLLRDTDYQENGDLPAETLDADFDRIWMVLMNMATGVAVAGAKFALFRDSYDGSVFLPASTPSRLIGWSSDGSELVNYEIEDGVVFEPAVVPDYLLQSFGVS